LNTTFDQIYALMERSFPVSEYRTREGQRRLLSNPSYRLYTTEESGRIVAFLSLWRLDGFRFIEHLAVDPDLRGGGVGRALLLRALNAERDAPAVLEVEPPETELSKRRIGFYQRNGFHLHDFPYCQPPMRPGQEPLPLRLMSWPIPLDPAALVRVRDELYARVYRAAPPAGRQEGANL